jgi:hypothetical protein
MSFFNFKRDNPKIYKGMLFLCFLSTLVIFFSLIFPYTIGIKYYQANAFLGGLMMTLFAFYRLKSHYRPAFYYIGSFILFFFGLMMTFLISIAIIPPNDLTMAALMIGSSLEFILLSMGMADRFNLIQEEISKNLGQEVESQILAKHIQIQEFDKKITAKAEELRQSLDKTEGMLSHIKKAVFTVNELGIVLEPVSKYSEILLFLVVTKLISFLMNNIFLIK